jgi:hypothetical protein
MTSPGGKLTAVACHLTNNVNKAEQLGGIMFSRMLVRRMHIFNIQNDSYGTLNEGENLLPDIFHNNAPR